MTTISNIEDLVSTLGGASRVAEWAGYEDSRGVYNWFSRGIPPSYHLRLTIEAARRGVIISGGVLGLEGDDARTLESLLKRPAE